MPILRKIETVADLIQELQTTEGVYPVFVFDGEVWPIEVVLTEHRSHATPHVWIQKAHDKQAALAGLIRDAERIDREIADLHDEITQNRVRLRQMLEHRDRIAFIRERAEGK